MSNNYKMKNIGSLEVNKIFSNQCIEFLIELHNLFDEKRTSLLQERINIQKKINDGWLPHFLEETKSIREEEWTILSTPDDLLDRRVEITGPPVKKMIFNPNYIPNL